MAGTLTFEGQSGRRTGPRLPRREFLGGLAGLGVIVAIYALARAGVPAAEAALLSAHGRPLATAAGLAALDLLESDADAKLAVNGGKR